MKTYDEILDEVAKANGINNFEFAIGHASNLKLREIVREAAERYREQVELPSDVFHYKELRAFAVDFAYYTHISGNVNVSHEKQKELFDNWAMEKLPKDIAKQLKQGI